MTKNIIIRTKSGKVCGIACQSNYSKKEYYSFLGIPYAIPPVGILRFQPPKPISRWRHVYDATYPRDDCVQYSFYEKKIVGSEDCLYLNIFISEISEKVNHPKAVIVLIHQGGLEWGSGSPKSNGSPEYIMHRDIIYVTLNYRLHVLGFLNLNIDECPGNVGLKDIVLALQWIQKNIKYFGGDPNNVTLIGNSSGSMLVHCLMMTPQAKGLFHKAISLGMYVQHPVINFSTDHVQRAFELGKLLNFKGKSSLDLLAFLRCQPLGVILRALRQLDVGLGKETKSTMAVCSAFLPAVYCVDQFITSSPLEPSPLVNPVPVITGICENEGVYTFLPEFKNYITQHFQKAFHLNTWSWLGNVDDSAMNCIEEDVRNFYRNEVEVSFPNRVQTGVIISELYDTFINILNKFHPECPVYLYKFAYEGELNIYCKILRKKAKYDFKGTSHSEDMLYWMCISNFVNDDDAAVIEVITKLFSNFAKTGNPISEEMQIRWRNSTIEAPCYLNIRGKEECIFVDGRLNEDEIQFWENLKKKYFKRKKLSM